MPEHSLYPPRAAAGTIFSRINIFTDQSAGYTARLLRARLAEKSDEIGGEGNPGPADVLVPAVFAPHDVGAFGWHSVRHKELRTPNTGEILIATVPATFVAILWGLTRDHHATRAAVRFHSGKRSPAGVLIAGSTRRKGENAVQTAESGPDSLSPPKSATLPVIASGHLGNLG